MDKETIIFGIYPILEGIKAGSVIDKIYVSAGHSNPKIDNILSKLPKDTTITTVPIEKLDRLTKGNHQGVVAIISPIEFHSLEDLVESAIESKEVPLFLVLDQISDVRNFGAIIRTAESTGVDGIIIQKKGGAPVSGDTIKTSAGAIFNTPICKVDHIKDAIFYFQGSGIKTVAATEKSSHSIYDLDLKAAVAIIVGSEGKGISPSVLKLVDEQAALPMHGKINSLNVSVACGAFLYEALRQRSV